MKKMVSKKELEEMTVEERISYFEEMREYCLGLKSTKKKESRCKDLIRKIYPLVRSYDYKVRGLENVPEDGIALFVCNHSNSHDFFTPLEVFSDYLGLSPTTFVASDDLNLPTRKLFAACNATLADRNDKESLNNGIAIFISDILSGFPGVIFGEATWNMHPYRPMQKIKLGSSNMGAIGAFPIIPTNIEYVEIEGTCSKEKELYRECVVSFGEPYYVSRERSLVEQTQDIQKLLEIGRVKIWEEYGIKRESLNDVDPLKYLNHTYLKKFDALGFKYDSEKEARFLYSADGTTVDNEYRMNENGVLVPGVTSKEEGKRFILK